ncbi:MAG: SDR family NAD(P)-dependent oxidoreductase [Gammaproteobacteria bacterium]|nr:SDR family NAD(P)-dependent oxidoreductase [Gammaproteobacteria bacterium]
MTVFHSFHSPLRCAVVGARGGLGAALCSALLAHPEVATLYALARLAPPPVARMVPLTLDLTDEASVAQAAREIAHDGPLDLVLVASGLLHDGTLRPEQRWEALDPIVLARLFAVNTIGPALCAKHFLPLLRRDQKAVFAALSARVGSIGDNRSGGWYGYRASKAALNMLLKTLALELSRRNPPAICVGLHPGTVDTGLSRPFQAHVPPPSLFTGESAAQHLLAVCESLRVADSGQVFAWDGAVVVP